MPTTISTERSRYNPTRTFGPTPRDRRRVRQPVRALIEFFVGHVRVAVAGADTRRGRGEAAWRARRPDAAKFGAVEGPSLCRRDQKVVALA
jgi:hypothetical protein